MFYNKGMRKETINHAPLIDLFLKDRPKKEKQLWIVTNSTKDKARPNFSSTRVHFMDGSLGKYKDETKYIIGYGNIYYNYKKNKIVIEPKLFRKPYHTLNVDRYFGDKLKSDVKLRNLFPINYRINYHLKYYDYGRNRINLIMYD